MKYFSGLHRVLAKNLNNSLIQFVFLQKMMEYGPAPICARQ